MSSLLILLLLFLLSSNAVTIRREKSASYSRVVISCLTLTSILSISNLYINPLEKTIGIFGGLLNVNVLTNSFNVFVLLVSGIILILTGFFPRKVYIKEFYTLYKILTHKLIYNKNSISNRNGEQFSIIEYALIIVFIISGGLFLMSTGDLVTTFLSIELQSYGLYILSSIYRDSESATASGLTYFLLGGLSSCFILLGSSFLYGNSGTTVMENVYIVYNLTVDLVWYNPIFIDLSFVILLSGFLFKVSAAPFHFWSPDVYDGVPTIVTTYIAIIAKISIFVLFIDLFISMMSWTDSWKVIFFISSFLSFFIGSVLGLSQYRIKRLFAYSTITHVGFILLALCTDSMESLQACIFYIFQYTLANINIFFILLSIGYSLYLYVYNNNDEKNKIKNKLIDENNSPIQLISQIKGFFHINSFLSLSFAVTIFSLIGVPPMAGFFAKQMILSGALDRSRVFIVLVAILTSVIGAAYYLNLIKEIFFFKHDYVKNPSINDISLKAHIIEKTEPYIEKLVMFKPENIVLSAGLTSTISIITLLLLFFMCTPEEWFNIVSIITLTLYK